MFSARHNLSVLSAVLLLSSLATFFLRGLQQDRISSVLRASTWSAREHWLQCAALWSSLPPLAPRFGWDRLSTGHHASSGWCFAPLVRLSRTYLMCDLQELVATWACLCFTHQSAFYTSQGYSSRTHRSILAIPEFRTYCDTTPLRGMSPYQPCGARL